MLSIEKNSSLIYVICDKLKIENVVKMSQITMRTIMITLSRRMAQKIVDTVKDVCGYDINFINTDGIIFASTDEGRIGEFHEIGKKVVDTREIIEVETDDSFYGTHKGVNIPFTYKNEIVAAIGISGSPDEVRQYAVLAQKITNLLMREQEIDTLAYSNKSQENAVVRCLIENKPLNQSFLIEFLKKKNLSVQDRYRAMILKPSSRYSHSNMAMLETEINRFFSNIPSAMRSIDYPSDYWIILNEQNYNLWRDRIRLWAKDYLNILTLGIGSSESINRQYISYAKADIAVKSMQEDENVCCYDQLVLEIITGSLSENVAALYREKVLCEMQPSDIELLQAYYENDMSLKDTAEALYVHKNTIQYQLNRIEQITGYNPRKFRDAVKLYMAVILTRLRAI